MIVTIDGPAGAGKSSVAREVARRLEFEFLDTGAMYRSLTLGALQRGVDWNDAEALAHLAGQLQIQLCGDRVWLEGRDVSEAIRTPEVTRHIRYVADHPGIRGVLARLQRQLAAGRNIVTEGRDQGTEVFPEAQCKVFLTASPEERARRRQAELARRGNELTLRQVLEDQNRRDLEDRLREVGRLRPAADAAVVATDGMEQEEVVLRVLQWVQTCRQRVGTEAASQRAAPPVD